ncbi:MAG TPA: hypothetical protein VL984_17190, partial [Acidimicrobiales bacterium]|nr:hypothetical protein [Acidimicrobiales bacterium]
MVAVEPVRAGPGKTSRWGALVGVDGNEWAQLRPVHVVLSTGSRTGRRWGYSSVQDEPDGFSASAEVTLRAGASLVVRDRWRASADELVVTRHAVVHGDAAGGFMTSLGLARNIQMSWREVTPFAPGAIYGDCEPVPQWAIGSPQLRRDGARLVLCREDRLGAPMFAMLYPDGTWVAVLHTDATATTVVADRGYVGGGEILIDDRLAFASLGGAEEEGKLYLGAFFPGSEGPVTYSTGRPPLRQYKRWRWRFHPLADGVRQTYTLSFRWGKAASATGFFGGTWRWAWDKLSPEAPTVGADLVVTANATVLAGQVRADAPMAPRKKGGAKKHGAANIAGIPLVVDAVTGRTGPAAPAIMGFVGANTDAAYVLLRVGDRVGGPVGEGYRESARQVLDCFARLDLAPPAGEGFDFVTGKPVTYRKSHGVPVVYTRSVADGCAGTLKAWSYEVSLGREHPEWLAWACQGGDWLLSQQDADGSMPRAWRAGTGNVLEQSKTAAHLVVAFLARLAGATGKSEYLDGAQRAAEFSWSSGGCSGRFAGATLDNPDVVDKEAAIYAMEGYLELYLAAGEELWLKRALDAAALTETWVYIWDVPMPVDALASDLHWKPGVPTAGQQLIATGVSTCDGFLAINAATFAKLYQLTSDRHFLDVARLVTHGTKAMLALPGRTYDLKGPGWQQEHWCLGTPRGYGL